MSVSEFPQRHTPLHSSDGHPRGSEQDVLFSGGFPSPPAVSGNDGIGFFVRDANPHFARWHDEKKKILAGEGNQSH